MSKLPTLYAVVWDGRVMHQGLGGYSIPATRESLEAATHLIGEMGLSAVKGHSPGVVAEYLPASESIPKERVRELVEKLTKREEAYRRRELWDMANRCEAQANVLFGLLKE